MLSLTAICDQYAWLYTKLEVSDGTWDKVIPVDGAYCAIKHVDGVDYVMFRGSVTFLDWIEDFDNFALPVDDPMLGPVHPGFWAGVRAVKAEVDASVGSRVVVIGHSLGAGHAAIWAGYRVAEGKEVEAMVLFGEPRAGGPKLSEVLSKTSVQSFRNADGSGHDYVTDVPRALPPELPYQHVKDPLELVEQSPSANDPWLIFRYHHFRLYARAFGCGGEAVLSLPG